MHDYGRLLGMAVNLAVVEYLRLNLSLPALIRYMKHRRRRWHLKFDRPVASVAEWLLFSPALLPVLPGSQPHKKAGSFCGDDAIAVYQWCLRAFTAAAF